VGVDFGLYASLDGGRTWTEMKGLPTQPVHDLLVHPRENDLIVATHGRGFFIADISTLGEMSDQVLAQDAYLFEVEPKVRWTTRIGNVSASTNFNGPSEPNGIVVNYFLKAPVQGDVVVQVLQAGRVLAETKGPNAVGVNQVSWNMGWTPTTLVPQGDQQGRRGGGGGRFGQPQSAIPSFGGTTPAEPGEYTVVMKAGGKTLTRKTRIFEDAWFDKTF
jgi:hypothetical protein